MSKGEIISHIGEGKYRVRQKLAVERIQQDLVKLNERIAQLAIDLPSAQLELLQADSALKAKAHEIDLAIPDLQAGTAGARARITALQAEMVLLQSNFRQLQLKVATLTAENLAALKRRNQLESVPEGREMDAWCADYTLELTGTVGLVDVNDEGGQGVLIQPGYDGEAAYSTSRDGALFPNLAQTGAQIFFNAAILPGVQKWQPRYRIGTISAIESDTCTVTLDSATSSVQDLPINETEALESVPIKYMECNGSAFEDGDRVLVRFTKTGPLVIGFAENPRSCGKIGFAFIPSGLGNPRRWWGEPFEDGQGAQINPPLGTAMGQKPSWFLSPGVPDWSVSRGNESYHGRRNWIGIEETDVLSWDGPVSRAFTSHDYGRLPSSGWAARTAPSDRVYHQGQILLSTSQLPGGHYYVRGAALHRAGGSLELLVIVSDVYDSNDQFQLWSVPLTESFTVAGSAQLLETFSPTIQNLYYSVSDWYFNASGDRAVWTFNEARDYGSFVAPGQAVYVSRWDIYGGVTTQKLYDAEDQLGAQSLTYTYSASPGFRDYDDSSSAQRSPRVTPIYADFIGDEEVTASLELQGSSETRQRTYDLSQPGDNTVDSGSHSESGQEAYTGKNRYILSNGSVMLELPDSATESFSNSGSWSVDYTQNSDRVGSGTFFSSRDEIQHENTYSIDARFGFVVASYSRTQEHRQGSGPVSELGQGLNYELSGSNTYLFERILVGTVGGQQLFNKTLYSEQLSQSQWDVIPFSPSFGLDTGTHTTSSDILAGPFRVFHPEGIWDCCGIKSRGKTAVSVWIYDGGADPVLLPDLRFNYQQLSGYSDVIAELFDRGGDEMTMYSLTVI